MSVLEEVLAEEYGRSLRMTRALEKELSTLPKGYVRARTIRGRTYYYLQRRDGDRVRSDYVRREDAERVMALVDRRREIAAALKEQERTRRQIERALGRRPAHE
jgi:hypothetical protein